MYRRGSVGAASSGGAAVAAAIRLSANRFVTAWLVVAVSAWPQFIKGGRGGRWFFNRSVVTAWGGELRHAIPSRHNQLKSQKRSERDVGGNTGNRRVRVVIWRLGETLANGQNLVLRRAWPAVWDCRARRGSRGTCAPPLGLGGRTTGLSRRRVRGYRRCEGGRYGLSVRVCCGLPYVVRYARARSTILLLRS
jgi:hypothetical protein